MSVWLSNQTFGGTPYCGGLQPRGNSILKGALALLARLSLLLLRFPQLGATPGFQWDRYGVPNMEVGHDIP